MIDYTYGDLFKQDSIDKQLTIEFEDGETITNSDIYQEEMSITESICSSTDLSFGNCEASVIKFKIANSFTSHIGQTVKVSVILDGNTDEPFAYGTYKVTSDKPTADRIYREIEAYDSLYEIINSDVAEWYEQILPLATSTCTLLQFRTSFFNYFGIEQVDTTLINDDITIEKTLTSTTLSGKDVLANIMSINGCFGHINRDNKFEYITLGSLTTDTVTDLTDYYKDCTYEDYTTQTIGTIQIQQDTEDGGVTYGSGDNLYTITGNFLVYGKSTDELTEIASNLHSIIGNISYRPATVTAKGNPCLEVGDAITLVTKYETVTTYILQRTLKGIQALTDTYTATGSEEYSSTVNSVTSSINQLAGKTQSLSISLEETKSEMSNISTTLGEKIDDSYSELYGYVETLTSECEDLQSQIDGAIETWFYDYEPTTSNYPASSWTDDTERAKHIGDLFYIIGDSEDAGQAYRYALVDGIYQWVLIEDTALTKALATASEALDTADSKRRVFTDTPYPPYDEGDLWTQGESGDILTCTTAKSSTGVYSESDWSKLNKYTDDTVAIEVQEDLKNNYMTTTQTESAISQTSDKILSTVSTTYTTQAVSDAQYQKSITNVEVLYALGTSSETAPTSGWSTTAPDWQDGYYMWQKTVTTYGNDYATVESEPTCLTGATGSSGESVSISSTSVTYQVGTSGTTKPTGSWSSTIPTVSQGSYLWTKTTVTYSDGSATETYSVSYNAIDGTDGADGKDGTDGTDGRGVSSTTITYQASTSGTTAPTGTWSTSVPSVSAGSYLWTRTVITYTDSTTTASYSVGKMGETGDTGATGSDGKGISSITNYYLATSSSSGVSTSTSGWSTTVQTTSSTNKYLWNYEVIKYTDSTSTTTSPAIIGTYGDKGDTGATGATGATGVGISSVTEYYALSTSTTAPSDSSFSTTVPTMTSTNKYLWNYEVITYTDSTTSTSSKKIIGAYGNTGSTGATGATGAQGETGVGVDSITNYYLASASSSGVTTSTSGWTTTIQTITSSKKYLWNYEVVNYTDGTKGDATTPIIIGAYGDTGATGSTGATGVGISSITEYYAVSTSNSTAPSSFSTTVPTMTTTNKYLWNYETITYTDSTTSSTSKRVIGVYGNTGATGSTGATGATGNGIASVEAQYYLSSSKTTQTGGSWGTTSPTWVSGYYVWTRTVVTYTDGTVTYTSPLVDSSWEAVNELETEVNSKLDDIDESITTINSSLDQQDESITALVTKTTTQGTNISTLQTQIKQTYTDISLTVNNGSTSSGITITGTKTDGTTDTASGTITMTGLVSFTDLSTEGSTTINGANISTGTITADKLTIGSGGNLYSVYDTFEQASDDYLYYAKRSGATASITDETQAYYGTKCLKIVASTDDAYIYLGNVSKKYGFVPVVAGSYYRISAYFKSASSSSVQLYIVSHTAINNTSSAYTPNKTATIGTDWTRVECTYTATSTYPYISIRVDNDTSDTTVYVDAIQVELVSTTTQQASDFEPGATTLINGDNITTGTISAIDISGSTIVGGTITGTTITATTGTIGGWTIGSSSLSYTASDTNYMKLDATNKSIISESGTNKAVFTAGYLQLYKNDTAYSKFATTYWTGTDTYGTAVNSEADAQFISFGNKTSSSDTQYNVSLLLNYGLDPDDYTEDVIVFGDERVTSDLRVHGELYLSSTTDNYLNDWASSSLGTTGIYTNGSFSTKDAIWVGNTTYSGYMLGVTGSAYISSALKVAGATTLSSTLSVSGTTTLGTLNAGLIYPNKNGTYYINSWKNNGTLTGIGTNGTFSTEGAIYAGNSYVSGYMLAVNGNAYVSSDLRVSGYIYPTSSGSYYFNGWSLDSVSTGIYTNGAFSTGGAVYVGNTNYGSSYKLHINGNTYSAGSITSTNHLIFTGTAYGVKYETADLLIRTSGSSGQAVSFVSSDADTFYLTVDPTATYPVIIKQKAEYDNNVYFVNSGVGIQFPTAGLCIRSGGTDGVQMNIADTSGNYYMSFIPSASTYKVRVDLPCQMVGNVNFLTTNTGILWSSCNMQLRGSGSSGECISFVDTSSNFYLQIDPNNGSVNSIKPFKASSYITASSYIQSGVGYLGGSDASAAVRPTTTGSYSCGTSSYRFTTVYATNGTISTSDARYKNTIEDFTEEHEQLFEKLQPRTFKHNNGERTHFGFIAQELKSNMDETGFSDMDVAAWCSDLVTEITYEPYVDDDGIDQAKEVETPVLDEDGNEQYLYSIRYSEFIALNTHMIQKYHADETAEIESLKSTIADLQAENETLKSEIAQIKEALGIS